MVYVVDHMSVVTRIQYISTSDDPPSAMSCVCVLLRVCRAEVRSIFLPTTGKGCFGELVLSSAGNNRHRRRYKPMPKNARPRRKNNLNLR